MSFFLPLPELFSILAKFNLAVYVIRTYICIMNEGIVRKELHLSPVVVENLQTLADKKKWSLKKYMEHVLTNESKKALKLKQQ